MKSFFLFTVMICAFVITDAQTKMYINKTSGGTDSIKLDEIKSITFKIPTISPIPKNGLVAWYKFDGNTADSSGNNNHGTNNGATLTMDRFGNQNKAYSFNGTSNYIQVQPSASLNFSQSFTVSVWSKKIGNKAVEGSLVATGGAGCAGGFTLQQRENGVRYEYQDANTANWCLVFFDTTLGIEDGKWHHFIYIVDGSLKIANGWVDGKHIISDFDLSSESNIGSTHPLLIGKLNVSLNPMPQHFNGTIDDIYIFNRALSVSDVQALYHEGGW